MEILPFNKIALNLKTPQGTLQGKKTPGVFLTPNNNYLCTYDLYSPVHNVLDACISITWGKWEGVGPWNSRVFWALENGNEPVGKFHLGPKKLENSRAQKLKSPKTETV